MTIGFLLNTCEPFYRGGYERRAWSFARELARQGHEVRIYTSCPREEVIEGVRFVKLAPKLSYFNARGVRNGFADLFFSLSILQLLWKMKPRELEVLDVCATPFLHLPAVAFVARMKQIPVKLTCHEALLAELPAYVRERGHHSRFVRGCLTQLLGFIYRTGNRLFPNRIAVSRRTEQALATEGFPARATVEFGLEPEAFAPDVPLGPVPGGPVQLVYCGRLTPIKSVDQTIRALIDLRGETRPFCFHIVGEGGERAALQRLAMEADAGREITFYGEVSEEAKRTLLGQSEIFVLSSPREGFSIATLEAMAKGCAAVVVSDPARPNGALDFVRDGREGRCAGPGVESLREVLRGMIEDAAARLEFRRAAWETAQQYRIGEQARRLVEAYRSVG